MRKHSLASPACRLTRSPTAPHRANSSPRPTDESRRLPVHNRCKAFHRSCARRAAYPLLEGSLTTDPDQRRLLLNEFDLATRQYTGRRWQYRLEADTATGQSIGDFTAVTDRIFLVIERDNFEGANARFKKIFVVNLGEVDEAGFLVKHEVADLMRLADPDQLASDTGVFTFPFQTIESVIPLSQRELGILNDNNYPFSAGRVAGQSDPNEFIIIRLDRPLVQASK